jgi:predicted patatin/cPLA2 family phospholipase
MGVGSYFKNGMLINLDYLYSGITNSTGKDPLDYEAIKNSTISYNAVSTEATTCTPRYFTKDDLSKDDYTLLKACCAMPVACRKPINFKGSKFFDGGLSDPIPYKKAFADGCDKLIIIITLPKDYRKTPMPEWLVKILLHKYPNVRDSILTMHNTYNNGIEEIFELQKQGKALVIYPEECFGIDTLTREKEGMEKLYQLGYRDGKKIEEYLNTIKEFI